MKIIIIFAPFACSYASHLHSAHIPVAKLVNTGTSAQHRSQDNIGNYAFGYNEDHATGGSTREEIGDAYGNKVGSYSLHVGDGRARTVNYVADHDGFRANIVTNEPGTAHQDPASVSINGHDIIAHHSHVDAAYVDGHGHHVSPLAPTGYGYTKIGYGGPVIPAYGYVAPVISKAFIAPGHSVNAYSHSPKFNYGYGYHH